MLRHLTKLIAASILGIVPTMAATANVPVVITFDEAISGLPFFRFDANGDGSADVVFSTTDPFGFNTAGPGPNQSFIQEPGLEGTTSLNPDLRVDFLQGAKNSIQFGFALLTGVEVHGVNFDIFDAGGTLLAQKREIGVFTPTPAGSSSFPEGLLSVDFDGIAAYALFDFDSEPPRYIIDNYTLEFASDQSIEGSTPDNPLLPDNIGGIEDPEFIFNIILGDGGLGIDFPIFIDPEIAIGYDYSVAGGPLFASVEAPLLLGGQSDYTLELPGFGDFLISAGMPFNLLDFNSLGFDSFRISGINVDEMLDPVDPLAFVTGLTFTSGGSAQVTMTPIVENISVASVPEPSLNLSFLALGTLGVASTLKRKLKPSKSDKETEKVG